MVDNGAVLHPRFFAAATTYTAAPLVLVEPTLQEILDNGGRLYTYCTISGVGDQAWDGGVDYLPYQYKFCSHVPPDRYDRMNLLALPNATEENIEKFGYYPLLNNWTDELIEDLGLFGGLPKAGEATVEILDFIAGLSGIWFTSLLLQDNPTGSVHSFLKADCAVGDTTLQINSGGADWTGSPKLLWIGQEVIKLVSEVSDVGGIQTFNIERGKLDTSSEHHVDRTPFTVNGNFFTNTRRLRIFYGAYDKSLGISKEQELGSSWVINFKGLTENLLAYRLRGISQQTFFDRRMFRIWDVLQGIEPEPASVQVSDLGFYGNQDDLNMGNGVFALATRSGTFATVWPDHFRFYLIDDEVLGSSIRDPVSLTINPVFLGQEETIQRGLVGTKKEDHTSGAYGHEVFPADIDLINHVGDQVGQIRYLFDPAGLVNLEDRTSSLVKFSDHPIAIVLCVMLSAFEPGDGLHMANDDGNWQFATLPTGVGIGIPITQVRLDTFLRVWDRTAWLRSPNTVLGIEKDETFTQWFEREFSWTRIVLRFRGGKWEADLISQQLTDNDALTLDDTNLLTKEGGDGLQPDFGEPSVNYQYLASTVRFIAKSKDGRKVTVNYSHKSFSGVFSQANHYTQGERVIEFNAPGLRLDNYTDSPMLRALALPLLLRFFKPSWNIPIRLPIGYDLRIQPGQLVKFSSVYLPSPSFARRGWTEEQCVVTHKKTTVRPGATGVACEISNFGLDGFYGKISAAGRIANVTDNGDGTYDVEISENKYTDPFSGGADIPKTDIEAFEVGWELGFFDRTGAEHTATRQTITAIDAPNHILTIDGNFGGALDTGTTDAGEILEFAPWSDAQTDQQTEYVAVADETTIGGMQAAWSYAEF